MREECFWDRFNNGRVERRTFVKVASLLGGGALLDFHCWDASRPPRDNISR